MEFVSVKSRTGEAVHAADARFPDWTMCGIKSPTIDKGLAEITTTGIQHPWRCEKCQKAVVRRSGLSA
jgi:hypothetical protein